MKTVDKMLSEIASVDPELAAHLCRLRDQARTGFYTVEMSEVERSIRYEWRRMRGVGR